MPPCSGLAANVGDLKHWVITKCLCLSSYGKYHRLRLMTRNRECNMEQSEAMLDLMLYCQDNMKIVEGLLTALIQGKNLAILMLKSDCVLWTLNCLLPPADIATTFATHVGKTDTSNAQVKFLAGDTMPDEHIVYDWASGNITPANYDRCHDYAHFMMSQLRLDPSKVVEQTESLAKTAVWRAIRKDTLSTALDWVARRAKIDIVLAGQPADRALSFIGITPRPHLTG